MVGDTVRYFATSASDNFEDAVLIYDLPMFTGQTVFNTFENKCFQKATVAPNGTGVTVLPASFPQQTFWFYQADVVGTGTEGYMVKFALYERDVTGALQLFGYFAWDPYLTVTG